MKYRFSFLIAAAFLIAATSCQKKNTRKVKKAPFGVTNEGDSVYVYTLKNKNGITINVLNYGGVIQSIKTPDKNGKMGDIVMGFNSIQKYQKFSPYFGALIGRFANRIAKGTFTLNDSTYHLPINDGPNSLHGGTKGFDKRMWKVTPFTTDSTEGLKLYLFSPDGQEGYPGNLKVHVTYTLNNENELRIHYKATTDKPTIINLTNHSYFNFDGGKGTIDNYKLMINADHFIPVDSTSIPTGVIKPVAGTPMDFRKPTKIGLNINDTTTQFENVHGGFDFCWVLNNPGNLKQLAVSVYDPKTGRTLKVYTTQPGIQFYSGNFLDGSFTGKGGVAYARHSAIVLETEHFPDSPNEPSFPSTVLNPGQTFQSTSIYKFGVKK